MSRRPARQGPVFVKVNGGPGPWPGQGTLVELGDQLAGGEVGAAPWTSWQRPPCFGSCLGLLSENLERKFLGAYSWEVAPVGPLSPGGSGRHP